MDTQYRMHKKIMDTIGHFYSEELEEGLKCGLADEDMDNEQYNAERKSLSWTYYSWVY
ncbi:C-terminal helicase domain-containing protein [Bacteroides salyersiae]|nr:C-terminal helicase domain-containing protein [Bacteroides salyersiae]